MATPTFTSVTPNSGHAGGRKVATIRGTNFQLPATTPAVGLVEAKVPTVAVEFDGISAYRVDVISDTELRVVIPPYRRSGPDAVLDPLPKVAVTIRNIDGTGATISGETITAAAAFQFYRAQILPPAETESQQIYRQVIREVINIFRRQLVANVYANTNVDFGDRGEIIIADAELPSVTIVGPRFTEDTENRHHWKKFLEQTAEVDGYEVFWPSYVAILEFDAVLASNRFRETLGMVQGCIEMFERTPYLNVPVTFGDINGVQFEFPFQMTTPPNVDIQDPKSNLIATATTFEVRRVPYSFDGSVDAGKRVENAYQQSEQVDSTTARPDVPILEQPGD